MNALDPIRERLNAATPGPWEIYWYGNVQSKVNYKNVCVAFGKEGEPNPNAEFIANAPTDIRKLLDEIEKRDKALARVEMACDAMDAGVSIRSGDPRTKSHAATAIRAAIRESLGEPS